MFPILVASLAILPTTADACSLADVCADVTASFTGGIIDETFGPAVRLDWSTDAEHGPVMTYQLHRDTGAGFQHLAFEPPTGSCGTPTGHSFIDATGEPGNFYRIEVVGGNGAVCHADADVEID